MIRHSSPIGAWLRRLALHACVAGIACLLAAGSSASALELGAPFSDQAVLQRGMSVPVWGWSNPGTKVTVSFAGQSKQATAGADGKWTATLDSLDASFESREMTIAETGGESRVLKDVLVGDVWLASGQSNMQWLAAKCDVGMVLQKQIRERVAAGKEQQPVIREAKVTDFFACPHPIEHASASWSTDAANFSGIAYSFSYHLFRELKVPIGILNCSFSQTSIQAWTPREGFADGTDAYTKAIYRKILETDPERPEHKAAWADFYQSIEKVIAENAANVASGKPAKAIPTRTPGNMSDNRDASWLFNARMNPMVPYAISGCIWNQGYANMGEGIVYYQNLHSLIGGWRKCWNRPNLPVYFNQFYSPGNNVEWDNHPDIGSTAEMRLGTWLARDIPNTGMAIQIDIAGAIHYVNKTLSGQRLALQALKNHYGQKLVADGPMFKSYEVKGSDLIVTFEHADGGLLVAETGTNSKGGLAVPTVIPNGDSSIRLFSVAGQDRVWHPATAKIDGDKVIVSSPQVKSPMGVSYATGGVGPQPNLYNRALIPATPFIQYDHKLVTSETWPDKPMKIAGVTPDPNAGGIAEDYRKLPILSSQFVSNAVLQADVPVTIWGAATNIWGPEQPAEGVIKFIFDGKEQTITLTPDMKEWSVTLPPMKAGAQPHRFTARLEIKGQVATERTAENVVFGDVYYVAAPADFKIAAPAKSAGIVRAITRKSKGSTSPTPRRFAVSTSTSSVENNRFASVWEDATETAAAIGQQLATSPDRPVGLIFMQSSNEKGSKNNRDSLIKEWIAPEFLNLAPSLADDYKQLAAMRPGNECYDANAKAYVAAWKTYWSQYVPQMIRTKRVPDAAPWGVFPTLSASVTTTASETHNVLVESFTPAALKGIVFLVGKEMVAADQGALFGEQITALANGMKKKFGGADVPFVYTLPAKSLAAKAAPAKGIQGRAEAIEINGWSADPELVVKIGRSLK